MLMDMKLKKQGYMHYDAAAFNILVNLKLQ